jgi:hypothetical protein
MNTFADSVGSKIKRFWKKAKGYKIQNANMENVSDSIHRDVQVSFIPFIGSNHAMSGNVVNDFSFNVIGGYSAGVQKLELGGAFNIVGGNVHGVQGSGIFNAVDGDVTGLQMAGIFNTNLGTATGAQLAGIFNYNWGDTRYFSGAGILNFARQNSRAVQVAGLGNVTIGDQESPQVAGLFNFSGRNANAQVTGLINISARNVKHAQVAGLINFAGKEMNGLQLSGMINYATTMHGVQVGFFNIADSLRGVPIGLMSFVSKGYHKIELSADEVFYGNLAFRTGVRQFYNILTAGVKPATLGQDATLWTFGYGLGTAPRLGRGVSLNFDITSNQIVEGNALDALNVLNKAYVGFDFHMMKKFSLTLGATLNAHLTETSHEGYWDIFSDYRPDIIYERQYDNDITMKMWLGGKIGLRFL